MTELIELPPQRTTGRYRVEVVCMGNICRSPTAAVVLAETLADARLTDLVEVQSSGTGGWHAGNPMDSRSAAVLRRAGYDPSAHRARKLSAADLAAADLVLTMDEDNLTDVRALWGADPGNRLRLFGTSIRVVPAAKCRTRTTVDPTVSRRCWPWWSGSALP